MVEFRPARFLLSFRPRLRHFLYRPFRCPTLLEQTSRQKTTGPGRAGTLVVCTIELRGNQNAVAVSNDLAARDLGLVGENRVELLLADPGGDEFRRLHTLLRRLEETE
jgi:hypothetical protein